MAIQDGFLKRPRLAGILCGLTLAVAQLFTPLGGMGTAQAATLTVTSTADSGAGSLRQALANAAPGDTITFALPNPSTITLSSELVIAKNLTISGPGAAALTISGNNATRVFFINPGAAGATSGPPATALTVQISGLTIANGKAQGGAGGVRAPAGGSGGAAGMGGALFSNHGNLTISGVVFDANQAQGGNSTGGGASFFGAAGGGGVGGNGGEGVFAGGGGGSGGALGGNGGGGGAAGISLPNGSNGGDGAAGGEGAGGGGGGIGDDCPGFPSSCTGPGANGGNGGNGGFGGGAGGGGASGDDKSGIAVGGNGGNGGFGGGGGGGGGKQSLLAPASAGGAGGAFGGNGGSSSVINGGTGGGGAGLGGAIFVRAGSLTLVDSSFSNNSAAGGSGAQNGQGKGGALFILSPATLNLACTTFSGNSATNAAGSGDDTHDRYGSVASTTPCDTTGPVANPSQSPAAAPSGWNNTAVTVSWNWSDPVSGGALVSGIDPANCTTSSVASGSATVTVSATCKDLAGNIGTASYSVRIDPTAPNANPSQSPAANGAGWNNTDVTVDWNWWFTGAIIDTANCTTSSTSSGEGTLTLSATCKDVALNQRTATYVVKVDKTAPVITGSRTPPANSEGWHNSAVTVDFTCQEQGTGSGLATNTVGGVTVNTQGANQTATNSGACVDVAGNAAAPGTVGPINIDLTKPTTTAEVSALPNANGWFKRDVPISFLCDDALSGIATCSPDEILSSEGAAVSSTPHTSSDKAGNVSDPSNIVTVKIDKTAPVVTVTGVSNGASYNLGSVPTAACSTTDALSGVATQATLSVTGGNPDGTGSFTATCNGATDLAGNSAAAVSVNYMVNAPTPTDTPLPPTATATDTPVPPTATPTDTPLPPTATPTDTPTATPTDTPLPPTATPMPAADACLTTALRDDFNRADGGLGSSWGGLTDPSYFTLAGNGVDVQLGGPVVWKPTTFGVDQAAFVTLSILDGASQSQGVLLKVQEGTIPNAGALAVVYDSLAKAVRVSTLRLNNFVFRTAYPNVPATFANGDKLTGCVQADGTVRVYQNATLLTTVTLSAADQSFFNAKGGKIGLWAISAPNAVFDDFGGGALPGVTGAALGANVPDEAADNGAALVVDSVLITASVPVMADTPAVTTTQNAVPVDATAPTAPDSSEQNQRIFLPIITNVSALAGTALGSPSGLGLLALVVIVSGGLIWQRRRPKR